MDAEMYYKHISDEIYRYVESSDNEISLAPVAEAVYRYRSDIESLINLCMALECYSNKNPIYDAIVNELKEYAEKRLNYEDRVCKIMCRISEDYFTYDHLGEIKRTNGLKEYSKTLYDAFLADLSEQEKEEFCGYLIYNDDYVKYAKELDLLGIGNVVWSMGNVEEELLKLCDFKNFEAVLDYVADLSDDLDRAEKRGYSFDETITEEYAIVLNRLFGKEIFIPQEDDRIIIPEIG